MTTITVVKNETRREIRLASNSLHAKRNHLEDGLFIEQKLTCANHADEEIALYKIGWKNFICPKCGPDYSIGRKITY
jgi:xanthine dehydrogenase iron-sulfur cluster and FAD-binding subunit A